MATTNRRTFLQAAGGATVGLALARQSSADQTERVAVAVIGTGGMGSNHLRSLAARTDVELAAVCDVDRRRAAEGVQAAVAAGQRPPAAETDLRRVLERPEIRAVFIATPDHWHVPAALLALAAGKHVYVEKPCSHNIREGRLLVEAAARSGRTVQVGTQSRSSPVVREAIERLHRGEIGDVLVAKAWNSQLRSSIGKTQPSAPPEELDFDLWLGPAPATAYRTNLLHANWRWWHDFGCGDMGNDGVHDLDVALWGLRPAGHPSRAVCLGGKCFFDDDQQFPDTQYAVFEYPGEGPGGHPKQLVFEQRIWSPYVQEGYENGAAFYGTQGMLLVGHSVGWKLFGPRNKLLAERSGSPALEDHHQDFLECVRGRRSEPAAPAAVGHQAATLVHLANIAARTAVRSSSTRRAKRSPTARMRPNWCAASTGRTTGRRQRASNAAAGRSRACRLCSQRKCTLAASFCAFWLACRRTGRFVAESQSPWEPTQAEGLLECSRWSAAGGGRPPDTG